MPSPDRGGRRALVCDVAGAAAASIVTALPVFLVSAQAVQIQADLGFGTSSLGLAVSLYYLGAAAFSITSGRFTEKVGAARVMRWSTLGAAVVLGLLAGFARSWLLLAALLVVGGVVSSATNPATNRFLGIRVRPGRQGLAFGVKQAALPGAVLIAGLAVPAVALTVGWRWAFAAAAFFAIGTALVLPKPRTTVAGRRAEGPPSRPRPLFPLVVLAVGFGLGVFASAGMTTFLVVAAVEIGLTEFQGGLLAALAAGAAIGGRVAAGALADKLGRARLVLVAAMLALGGAGYALLAAGSSGGSGWVFVVGSVVAFGLGWGWNGVFNFALVHTYPHAPAQATGVTSTAGRLAGVAGPAVFGFIATHASFPTAWVVTCGVAIAGAAVILLARRMLLRAAARRSMRE